MLEVSQVHDIETLEESDFFTKDTHSSSASITTESSSENLSFRREDIEEGCNDEPQIEDALHQQIQVEPPPLLMQIKYLLWREGLRIVRERLQSPIAWLFQWLAEASQHWSLVVWVAANSTE